MTKSVRQKLGQIFKVPLHDGTVGFGQVTGEELHTFFDILKKENESVTAEEVVSKSILFRVSVMRYAITKGLWPVIGIIPPSPLLLDDEDQFQYDTFSKKLVIWKKDGQQVSATWDECKGLENFSVWEAGAVAQRLRDHFAGRPCWYLEIDKPGWQSMPAKEFYKQYGYNFHFVDDD